MSPKELLYIADGLGHEQHMECCCQSTAQQLSDPQLKAFVENLAERHGQAFNKLYSLLG
jgi:hypothetical protein